MNNVDKKSQGQLDIVYKMIDPNTEQKEGKNEKSNNMIENG